MGGAPRAVANSVLAASLALAMATSSPLLASADVPQPAVVERYGSTLVAADDVSEAAQKFLDRRAALKTQYDVEVEGNYKTEAEVQNKKGTYSSIVGGLILVAFVAPMVTFYYYTAGK